MKAEERSRIWLLSVLLLGTVVIVNMREPSRKGRTSAFPELSYARDSGMSMSLDSSSKGNISPSDAGKIEISDKAWTGRPFIRQNSRLESRLLSPDNAYWQVRLDRDDNKIYDLFPNNYPIDRYVKLPEFNYIEWRIKPGQSAHEGIVIWEIRSKSR